MKARFILTLSAGLLAAGCAGSRWAGAQYVEAKDSVYVAVPTVPPAVDSLLAPLGWDSGKFALELRKEISFRLNRKGVATSEDSAGAKTRLEIAVDSYSAGDCAGRARLETPKGTREIPFREKRKAAREQRDPTIDDIRSLATRLAESARTDPRHRKGDAEVTPGVMIMLF